MSYPRVYADFHNADGQGRLRLNCTGTTEDLSRQKISLEDGLLLTLYSEDVEVDGRVQYSTKESLWVATIDWDAIRSIAVQIFYSWQSDLPNSTNRGFIQTALERAAQSIRNDPAIAVEPVVDRDTAGVPGSPDIADTILEKIDSCQVFVCDVSIINPDDSRRPAPNPNVLLELGFALKRLGWPYIIMIFNSARSPVEHLPFDLRTKRVTVYSVQEDDPDKAGKRHQLESQLRTALQQILQYQAPSVSSDTPIENNEQPTEEDFSWRDQRRAEALEGFAQSGFSTYVEAFAVLSQPQINYPPDELLQVAYASMIDTFGWPIGIMDLTQKPFKPRPINSGIVNTVIREGESYDFWALRQDGSFYLLQTLFEDSRGVTDQLFFNTRIVRTAEMLMYLSRLYEGLNVPENTTVNFILRHVGLAGRHISATSNRPMFRPSGPASEGEIESPITIDLSTLDDLLSQHVQNLLDPVFTLFDFFQPGKERYDQIVTDFKQGKVT